MSFVPSQKRTSWGTVIYTLDGAIQDFFHAYGGTSVTQSECDTKTVILVSAPLTPVPIQGQFSYTVVAGPAQAHIVQFRAAQSKLDMDIMGLAVAVHPDFAPRCSYHGQIGADDSPLHIYVMHKREGLCSFESRDSSVEGASAFVARQFQTVSPAVFALLPFVLNHGDLSESNILVNKDNGRITGIIDWAEAEVSPFGLSLWGLESLLGYGRKGNFYFYDNAEQLRDEFWRIFEAEIGTAADALSDEVKHAIKVARMAGLLLSWCFIFDEDMARQKVRDTDAALGRADIFCTEGI
ncbi:hypothetical protein PG991_016105 [Apiospora marii]|uniref:Aminoglycoside phosphotransferase domain-containing protein n=1 Tax=Apiospora marii TaxID=335849 RepID=A0ABR1R0L6_9PEZI